MKRKNEKQPEKIKASDSFSENCRKIEQKGQWIEVQDGKVVKLKPGESIQGLLVAKDHSAKYNVDIHKIQKKGENGPAVILGTTVLDRKMQQVEVGTLIKIERLEDTMNSRGQRMQDWKVYQFKES